MYSFIFVFYHVHIFLTLELFFNFWNFLICQVIFCCFSVIACGYVREDQASTDPKYCLLVMLSRCFDRIGTFARFFVFAVDYECMKRCQKAR